MRKQKQENQRTGSGHFPTRCKEAVMHGVFFICALVSIAAVVLICLFLFVNGIPAIGKIGIFNFLLGDNWAPTDVPASYGILPMRLYYRRSNSDRRAHRHSYSGLFSKILPETSL